MESKILENPCSSPSPSQSTGYTFNPFAYRRSIALENYMPLMTNQDGTVSSSLHKFNEDDIAYALSRLAVSSNVVGSSSKRPPSPPSVPPAVNFEEKNSIWAPAQRSNASGTPSFPSTVDAVNSYESIRLPVNFQEKFQENYCSSSLQGLAERSTAQSNEPFGFPGAHLLDPSSVGFVDPGSMGFFGASPYQHVGNRDGLMGIYERQYFNDTSSSDLDSNFLHGKQPISRNTPPISPLAQQNDFYISGPFLFNNVSLLQPDLTAELMRGGRGNGMTWGRFMNLDMKEVWSEQEIEVFLSRWMELLDDLLINQVGAQFVQKLFVASNDYQRTRIICFLTRSAFKFITICLNTYGARAIQKLLEKVTTAQQIRLLMSVLVPGAVALSNDPNGQHVIHYCVKNFSSEYVEQLLIEIANHCYKIATNKSGCCVLQSCVGNARGEIRKRLISEILAHSVNLAEDPYGNYVVQFLLGLRILEVTTDLVRRFQGRFVYLSRNKYASNVVEKFLTLSGENHSALIILEILQSPNAAELLVDPFGNFVIQSALSASRGLVHNALASFIHSNAASMQSSIYGKKILAWFDKKRDVYHA